MCTTAPVLVMPDALWRDNQITRCLNPDNFVIDGLGYVYKTKLPCRIKGTSLLLLANIAVVLKGSQRWWSVQPDGNTYRTVS